MKPEFIPIDDIERVASPSITPHAKSRPITFTLFQDCATSVDKRWILKNVIALGETSSWIAPPGAGKSALLTEIAVHVSAARDWRGNRSKKQVGVVYFAFERADLVRRRLHAYSLRDDVKRLPIAVAGDLIDLMKPESVVTIISTIKAAEKAMGIKVGLGIFDTYAKGIAAGGGDEDKARDQNFVFGNLKRVHEAIDIHIALIGHTGKNEDRGSRGSNAHVGDVDMMVQISGDGQVKTAKVIKANDRPEGLLASFMLEPFEFGRDEDGDPITTAIVEQKLIEGIGGRAQSKAAKLSDRQKLALAALHEVLAGESATPAPAALGLPVGTKVVSADVWRDEMLRRSVIERDSANPRADFKRLRDQLLTKMVAGFIDDLVWAA